MKALPGALLFCLAGTACAVAQEPHGAPTIDGFVTRVLSPSEFSVNGIRIVCGPETRMARSDSKTLAEGCPAEMPFVGEEMTIFGRLDARQNAATASRIEIQVPADEEVFGSAVVEAVAASPPSAEVSADGYRILLPPDASLSFAPPLHSLADVKAGAWAEYKAHLRADGVLVAKSVRFEAASGPKENGDPAATQLNPKKLPSWPDTMMEQRVAQIGQKLIPSYQRTLPDGDPAKIAFRFELVDGRSIGTDPIPLPSGVVVLSRMDIQRLQNDSQVAALLADAMACILERQIWRLRIAQHAAASGESIVDATEAFIPGAKQAGFHGSANDMRDVLGQEYAQSARVGLELMHDAGFDIEQAPIAWWLLANHDKQLSATTLPYQSANVYRVLGTLWNNPAASRPGAGSVSGSHTEADSQ